MKHTICLFLLLGTAAAQVGFVSHRNLAFSTFAVVGARGYGVADSCATAYCTSTGVRVLQFSTTQNAWPVVCPAAAGYTCTYSIDVKFPFVVSPGDYGLIAYTGDGNVSFMWPSFDQSGQTYAFQGSGDDFVFVVRVKNTISGQAHPVNAYVYCVDQDGDGCYISQTFYNHGYGMATGAIKVDVYTP